MDKSYHTQRLHLKPTDVEDAEFLLELLNSPRWIRFIGDRNVRTRKDAISYIQHRFITQRQKLGYSTFTILKDQEKIGIVGLYDRDGLEGIDLGFALLADYEGQGYAFEAASCIVQSAFVEFGLETLKAVTLQENSSSKSLLERLGFSLSHTMILPNDTEEVLVYKRTLPNNSCV